MGNERCAANRYGACNPILPWCDDEKALEGVRKGALTEEQAEAKYEAWLSDKESKIGANVKAIADMRLLKTAV